jgi:hypothetical protein
MKSAFKGIIAGLGLVALGSQADASVYTGSLNVISDANIGIGTLGTVTVTDIAGGVTVDVSLIAGINFVNTGGPHTPFVYNLNATPTSINFPVGSPFSADGSSSAAPYGTFNHGVDMTGGNGAPGKHGPLDFTINGITTANFNTDSFGYYFAADLIRLSNGATGSVAAANFTAAVPEPSTWAMMILGFAGVGFMAYRRKNKMALNAA